MSHCRHTCVTQHVRSLVTQLWTTRLEKPRHVALPHTIDWNSMYSIPGPTQGPLRWKDGEWRVKVRNVQQ